MLMKDVVVRHSRSVQRAACSVHLFFFSFFLNEGKGSCRKTECEKETLLSCMCFIVIFKCKEKKTHCRFINWESKPRGHCRKNRKVTMMACFSYLQGTTGTARRFQGHTGSPLPGKHSDEMRNVAAATRCACTHAHDVDVYGLKKEK